MRRSLYLSTGPDGGGSRYDDAVDDRPDGVELKIFAGLKDVLDHMAGLDWQGTLFVDQAQWRASPREARFVYLAGDDELEDIAEGERTLPRFARDHDVRYFLDFQLFEDVILKQEEWNPHSTLDEFIRALNHYREYDAFYWPAQAPAPPGTPA